ncbi:MAG: efflux RND transporter periplasmic adaptor subunit [Bryobacteraceae bacterium]
MPFIKPSERESLEGGPVETHAPDSAEERLRQENLRLRRQLEELKASSLSPAQPIPGHGGLPARPWRPSSVTIWAIVLGVVVLTVVGFLAGYIPRKQRNATLVSEAAETSEAVPNVGVVQVQRSGPASDLELPGSIQAVTEAPILARADGYIQKRLVDIGDRVKAGQPLAEIEAPELDQQVLQAKANLQQAQSTLDEAEANYEQGKTQLELARVTAQRWNSLVGRGVVSKQENDQYQSQFQAQQSSVRSLEKAINAQTNGLAAAQANLSRLQKMQSYLVVRAPFDGIITQRNVDVGALVNAGATLLYRVAQMSTLRTYVNVPQANASFIRTGQAARLTVPNLPGRHFTGTIARTSSSLDPSSRTLLVEVQVPNNDGALLPGMYAKVDLNNAQSSSHILVPSDVLIVRPEGTQVAMVGPDHIVHLKKIEVGRDYGDKLEILSGVEEGDTLIPNPGDNAREGLKVNPVK